MPTTRSIPFYNWNQSWLPGGERSAGGVGPTTVWLPGGDRDPRAPTTAYPQTVTPSSPSRFGAATTSQASTPTSVTDRYRVNRFTLDPSWQKTASDYKANVDRLMTGSMAFSDVFKQALQGLGPAYQRAQSYVSNYMSPEAAEARFGANNQRFLDATGRLMSGQYDTLSDYEQAGRGLIATGRQNISDTERNIMAQLGQQIASARAGGNLAGLRGGTAAGGLGSSAAAAYIGSQIGRVVPAANLAILGARQNFLTGTELPFEQAMTAQRLGLSDKEIGLARNYFGAVNDQTLQLAQLANVASSKTPELARQYINDLQIGDDVKAKLLAMESDLRRAQYEMEKRGTETFVTPNEEAYLTAPQSYAYLANRRALPLPTSPGYGPVESPDFAEPQLGFHQSPCSS